MNLSEIHIFEIYACLSFYLHEVRRKENSEHRRNCYNLLDDQSISLVNFNQIYNIIYIYIYCHYVAIHQIEKEIFTENSSYTEFRYVFCYSPCSLRAREAKGDLMGGSRQGDYREETLG